MCIPTSANHARTHTVSTVRNLLRRTHGLFQQVLHRLCKTLTIRTCTPSREHRHVLCRHSDYRKHHQGQGLRPATSTSSANVSIGSTPRCRRPARRRKSDSTCQCPTCYFNNVNHITAPSTTATHPHHRSRRIPEVHHERVLEPDHINTRAIALKGSSFYSRTYHPFHSHNHFTIPSSTLSPRPITHSFNKIPTAIAVPPKTASVASVHTCPERPDCTDYEQIVLSHTDVEEKLLDMRLT